MKIIFLDIDGVLNNMADVANNVHLDPFKVCLLNNLTKQHDAHIIISSTWRRMYSLEELQNLLWTTGFSAKKRIIGVTPTGPEYACRAEEIWAAYEEHGNGDPYVILDDNEIMKDHHEHCKHMLDHFVHTYYPVGLSCRELKTIDMVLNGEKIKTEPEDDD
jgi:hypothetical protein